MHADAEHKFEVNKTSAKRAEELFREHQAQIYRNTDKLFARLMIVQWIAGILAALFVSPQTWSGQTSQLHIHVWAAIFLGGAITIFPVWLTRVWPGAAITRQVIAVSQMLMSGLLIGLSGGRIETHFHIFGSLVILSFYRDWRVLVSATVVVAGDHFFRGLFWPYSVYGVLSASPWRFLEHAGWVIFEDVFLFISCLRSTDEMRSIANRTAALEASERNFRQIFEEAPIGMAVVGLDQRFKEANAALCQMVDYSIEELATLTPLDITHPDDLAISRQMAQAMLNQTGKQRIEKRYLRKDGGLVWSTRTGCLIHDEAGNPRHFLLMIEDISERKRAEMTLQEKKAELEATLHANQLIMDNSRDVICTNDAEGRFQTVSAACTALWGYTPAELIGKSCGEMVHPDDRETSRLANIEIMAGNPAINFENRYIRKDGSVVDVLWSAYWSEDDGTMFQVARDITQRKRAEAALQETNRQLEVAHHANQLIMDNSQDVICTIDANGRFLSTNAACEDLFGYTPDELIGRSYLDFVHPDDRPNSEEADSSTRIAGKITDFVNRYVRKDGVIVDVLWSASWSKSDEIFFCVAHDVTERQRIENALREAKEEADRANRAKSEFLSRMSHELRTPLNAILGFGQLLERNNQITSARPHLHHIVSAGRHLLDLINEVLDISRIEADKLQLSVEPVSVSVALREAVDLIRPLAAEHSINLFVPTEDQIDYFVLADRQRFKQVLLNLLTNGVKYTPSGGAVTISCTSIDQNMVRLEVRDTGIGIASEKLSRVFTPFDRLGAEQSTIEGTGLGLALSQRLVQAMHGSIGVESKPGEGSTFWVQLSQTKSPFETIAPAGLADLRSGRLTALKKTTILYIEDNHSNLTLVEQIVREEPEIELLTAMQGQLGLDLARQHKPDLILLDLHLPDLPGWEVLAQLQADETTRHIPTIVLSADATPGQIKRLRDAGALDYLTKPIDVAQFCQLLEKTAARKEEYVAA